MKRTEDLAWEDAIHVGNEALRLAIELVGERLDTDIPAEKYPMLVAAVTTAIAADFTANHKKDETNVDH